MYRSLPLVDYRLHGGKGGLGICQVPACFIRKRAGFGHRGELVIFKYQVVPPPGTLSIKVLSLASISTNHRKGHRILETSSSGKERPKKEKMSTGSCACGAISIKTTGDVQAKALCHCADCKKVCVVCLVSVRRCAWADNIIP